MVDERPVQPRGKGLQHLRRSYQLEARLGHVVESKMPRATHAHGDTNEQEDAVAALPVKSGASSKESKGDVGGTMFRQKSIEASNANKRIRELEAQLEILRSSTAA